MRFEAAFLALGLTACGSSPAPIQRSPPPQPIRIDSLVGIWREAGQDLEFQIAIGNGKMTVTGLKGGTSLRSEAARCEGDRLEIRFPKRRKQFFDGGADYLVQDEYRFTFHPPSILRGIHYFHHPEYVSGGKKGFDIPPGTDTRTVRWDKVDHVERAVKHFDLKDTMVGRWEGRGVVCHVSIQGTFERYFSLVISLEQGVYRVNGIPARYEGGGLTWENVGTAGQRTILRLREDGRDQLACEGEDYDTRGNLSNRLSRISLRRNSK